MLLRNKVVVIIGGAGFLGSEISFSIAPIFNSGIIAEKTSSVI